MMQGRRELPWIGLVIAASVGVGLALSASAVQAQGLVPEREWDLTPYLELSGTYDSNARLGSEEGGEDSDLYGETEVGVIFDTRLGKGQLRGGAFVFGRGYRQESGLDHAGGGERLAFRIGGDERLGLHLSQSYQHVEDYSRIHTIGVPLEGVEELALLTDDRASRSPRDLSAAGGQLAIPLGGKTEAGIGYQFSHVDYEEKRLFDSTSQSADLEFGWRVTPKSSTFVMGEYGVQDSDALPDNPEFYKVHGGWQTQFTGKTAFRGSVGIEVYDDKTDAVGRDSTQEILSFEVAGLWRPVPAFTLQLSGGNSIDPSTFEPLNTRRTTVSSLGATVPLTDSVSVSGGGSYRRESYRDDAEGADKSRELDCYGAEVGLRFAPPEKWYSLFINGSYEKTYSNLPNEDYDQARITVGARAAY